MKMLELHIVLKSTMEDGSHEQIDILDCGKVSANDGYLVIYSKDDSIVLNVMGQFYLPEVIGYWVEES